MNRIFISAENTAVISDSVLLIVGTRGVSEEETDPNQKVVKQISEGGAQSLVTGEG